MSLTSSGDYWEQHRFNTEPETYLHGDFPRDHPEYFGGVCTGSVCTDACYCLLVSELSEEVSVNFCAPTNCGYRVSIVSCSNILLYDYIRKIQEVVDDSTALVSKFQS